MKKFILFISLWFLLPGQVFSQNSRSSELFGARGLVMTEKVLAGLDLPNWYWGGAHVTESVEQNYRLVDGELLDDFFGKRSNTGLKDPQHILNDDQQEIIEKLIANHDMKSAMPLCVNVLAHGQTLSLSEDQIKLRLKNMFKNKNAIIVFYYYGYARGVKGYVMIDELGFIEDWEVDELFLKSARDASLQMNDFLEMESFVKDVSKRSYWLEQRLMPPLVAEKITEQEDKEKKKLPEWDQYLLILSDHTLTIILGFLFLAAGGCYFLWSRKWRKFVISDGDVPVRLGADYGANVSDPVKFSDTKVSLTEQYENLKNREL